MKACGEFLLADHTFIPSWDHSLAGLVGLWWDLTTSSIIAAKTLKRYTTAGTSDIQLKESSADASGAPAGTSDIQLNESIADASGAPTGTSPIQLKDSSVDASDAPKTRVDAPKAPLKTQKTAIAGQQPEQMQKQIIKLVDRIWRGQKPADMEGFNWKKRRPGLRYHADSSVQSLEDTPDIYQLKHTKEIKLRPHLKKLISGNYLQEPHWTLEEIRSRLPAENLRWVSCIDYALSGTPEIPEVVISSARGRAFCRWNVCDGIKNTATESNLDSVLNHRQELWDLFFLGIKDMNKFPGLNLTADQKRFLGASEPSRKDFLERYRTSLFRVLHDSFVDLGTKYRIILAKSMPPVALQAAVYIWHPEGIDTLDDHLGTLSHFDDSKSAGTTDDMWLTSITLAHWRPQSELESKISETEAENLKTEKLEREKLGREKLEKGKEEAKRANGNEEEEEDWDSSDEGDTEATGPGEGYPCPPVSVKDLRVKGGSDPERHLISSISEQAISLVITGDGMGRYWTCSLVCDLMDDRMMARYAAEAQKILQNFIHQQYTGRALVFIYLLGEICRSLSLECERFMRELDQIMGLQRNVLLKGMPWMASDALVKKMKDMLWGLQALRIFHLKLKSAIEKVEDARTSMKSTIEWGRELRPLGLKRESDQIWEEFNKRYSRLKNAHEAINERISQGARLREGMGSVVSIEQNENIGLLTWMTVAYLPLSFAAALFSVQHEILPTYVGLGEFLGLLFGFLVFTFIIALSLGCIKRRLRAIGSAVSTSCTSTWNSAKQFIKKQIGQSRETGSDGLTAKDTNRHPEDHQIIPGHSKAYKRTDEEAAQP
ncbi:hypothetical protein B0I35DRAFT_415566, partial [Stachybotrys elegans]